MKHTVGQFAIATYSIHYTVLLINLATVPHTVDQFVTVTHTVDLFATAAYTLGQVCNSSSYCRSVCNSLNILQINLKTVAHTEGQFATGILLPNASCECYGYNTPDGNTHYTKMKKAVGLTKKL